RMLVDSNEMTILCRQLAKILPEQLALKDDMTI
ncbi:hypothetical protein, partial [Acinetobacter baumannii]